jgi:hypothetical protein
VPIEESETLKLGKVIHGALELWYKRNIALPVELAIESILDFIDRSYPDRIQNAVQQKNRHLARAMLLAYVEKYPGEDFEVVFVEKEFKCPIINPASGYPSRTYAIAGKVDAVVRINGEYFLLEHKTASNITGDYIERLPMDFQVTLYSDYLGQAENIVISGIIYNVIAKAQLKQGMGETEEEFQERRAALIAKSKTGRTTAKRKVPEPDDAFQERLAEKYRDDGMFHRERLYVSRDQYDMLHSEVWELTQQLLLARRTGRWYMNTDYCFHYNRPCQYFPICRSNENPNVIENMYRVVQPHPELDGASSEDAGEIF